MKKDFYITLYLPGYNLPSMYESYNDALRFFDPSTQKMYKVQIETPDVEEFLQAEEIN